MTAVFSAPSGRKLLPIDGVTGNVASFDDVMLGLLRWAATHYVAPLSVILKRTLPPNVPRSSSVPGHQATSGASDVRVIVARPAEVTDHVVRIIERSDADGGATMIVAPTIVEVAALEALLVEHYGDRVVVATSSSSGKDATASWTAAAVSGHTILIGTREIALWPVAGLRSAVVIEDSRRVMKSPSTPTLGVRELLAQRRTIMKHRLDFVTPLPSLEALAMTRNISSARRRAWPLVEVADRGEEPPSRSLLLDRTRMAISHATKKDQSVFVLVPARGYAPAFRCISCGELRRCLSCGTAATRQGDCRRCGATLQACAACSGQRFESLGAGIGSVRDAIARSIGDAVGLAGENRLVTVGSERDIVTQEPIDLAVAVDVDGMSMAPTYRAAEDALRLLVRTANLLRPGRGNRLIVQTALPNQPVIETLRSGNAQTFLEIQTDERKRASFPPYGELIALEIDRHLDIGSAVPDALEGLATVLGPAAMKDRDRWLIQGQDLTHARVALRTLVSSLRERGARVRIDADPIDL